MTQPRLQQASSTRWLSYRRRSRGLVGLITLSRQNPQTRVERADLQWHIAARPSDIAKLPEGGAKERLKRQEHGKASVRAKLEHPFRVIKRQFGLVMVRFRGLAKNTAHVVTLLALSNLWMARRQLMAMAAAVHPQTA